MGGSVRTAPDASFVQPTSDAETVSDQRVRAVGSMPTTDRRVLSLHARGRVLGVPPAAATAQPGRDVRLGRGTADTTRPPPTCAGRGVRWPLHSPHQSCAAVVRQAGACNAGNAYNAYNADNAVNA